MRALLRLSWRDIRRAKGRSALVMAMIGLPVLVITCAMTIMATVDVNSREALGGNLGAVAEAAVFTTGTQGPIEQDPDANGYSSGERRSGAPLTGEQVAKLLGARRVLPYNVGFAEAWLKDGYDEVGAVELDVRDPLTRGIRTLVSGAFPASPGEVMVSEGLAERGVGVGDTIKVTREPRQVRVVGVYRHPHMTSVLEVTGMPGVLLPARQEDRGTGWLADTAAPVTWEAVQRINKSGLRVVSRAVINDPPGAVPWRMAISHRELVVAVATGVVMAVLETVLLAGPAFAVGLRRRRRELAMLAAHGASPSHLRTVVLADGLILGGSAAVLATVLGVVLGIAGSPVAGRLGGMLGPVEVPWLYVLGVAALGLVSGLLAALVPAVQAGRQPAALVLAGRTPEIHARAGRPRMGLALAVAGLAATYLALREDDAWVLAAAVLIQLGLVALMPWLVKTSGRLAARLPLPMRLSVRDAARHRIRTASAAAAVMATTTTVLAIAISVNSNDVAARDAYYPGLPAGTTMVGARGADDAGWDRVRKLVAERLPARTVEAGAATDARGRQLMLGLTTENLRGYHDNSYGRNGADLPIGDPSLLRLVQGRDDPVAAAALAGGRAVVFDQELVRNGRLMLSVSALGEGDSPPSFSVPAVYAPSADPHQGGAVLARQGLEQAGLKIVNRRLYAAAVPAEPLRFERDLVGAASGADLYVEDGYDPNAPLPLLIMLVGALVLVVGGTLVATRLAAADLRPEQAALAAIGAPALTRRLVLATQAGYIAGLGALVGVVAGTVTGVALAWPYAMDPREHAVSVPWGFALAVAVGLPLLAALVGGLLPIRVRLTRRLA
ncbi:FtsX-like permease family protein [Nonomuraea sp. NPDC050556]|uniref:FtsX-like permease family protein n=1 Tax=Nonomuraea sp. NPDC050556 TaxID=3364369 RepID=UPI00379998F3